MKTQRTDVNALNPAPVSRLFDNKLTTDELIESLRHCYKRATIYSWIQQGMPSKKIRGRLWFDREEVRAWIEGGSSK